MQAYFLIQARKSNYHNKQFNFIFNFAINGFVLPKYVINDNKINNE